MPAHDDVEQILRGGCTQCFPAKVFEDKEVDGAELVDQLAACVCGLRFLELIREGEDVAPPE